ncbi:MAG TPA: hypothetical protein VK473_00960 [Terriglobales bacterium]|nr:hypothetical protein [Terriglobales bacterium]
MAETLLAPGIARQVAEEKSSIRLLTAVMMVSFASLLLELALTRLFSVILFYHFAFLAISIALLGLGAGGVFAYLAKAGLLRWPVETIGSAVCAINAVLVLLVLEIDLHVPVFLSLSLGNFLRLSAIYLVSALPFFFTGLLFAVLFARRTREISRLYAADLVGGALACLAIVGLLNRLGGPNTVLVAGVVMSAGSWTWALDRRQKTTGIALTAIFASLIVLNRSGRLIDIIYAKGARRDQPWVEFAKWNAISRVEVDSQNGAKVIVIDADASTYIMAHNPAEEWEGSDYEDNLMSAAPSVTNILRPRGEYAIIGAGGGVDVLRAVANGSPSVTAIEINPIIADDIMRGRYAGWSYHLYQQPQVHIGVSDGRSWIRHSRRTFDVLQMTLVDTWASTAAGAFSLSENNLYTVEAFREYFDHLNPSGFIAITRWEFRQPREALRVVSQAMEALGSGNLGRNFIVVSDGNLNEDGRPVTVLAKRTPFTEQEEWAVRRHLEKHANLVPLFLPSDAEKSRPANLDSSGPGAFRDLILAGRPQAFAQTYPYNVAPVHDSAPFFFFTLKPSQLLRQPGTQSAIDWKVNMGVVVLLMVLVISLLAVVAFLLLPLLLTLGRQGKRRVPRAPPLAYFIAIGLAYIVVEVTLIQRLVLFLGHPIYALTVVVFLMLLSSGVGSAVSRKWLADPGTVWLPTLLVAGALLLYLWLLPAVLRAMVGSPYAVKLAMSAVLLVPLGFAMGMPFPAGLRMLEARRGSDNIVEWAWAMNATSSVLGSVLAMAMAIEFGLSATLACGAAAYLLAACLTRGFRLDPRGLQA